MSVPPPTLPSSWPLLVSELRAVIADLRADNRPQFPRSSPLSFAIFSLLVGCSPHRTPAQQRQTADDTILSVRRPLAFLVIRDSSTTLSRSISQEINIDDGRSVRTVFAEQKKRIAGFDLSDDGARLTVVRTGMPSYGGAIVPFYLSEVEVMYIELSSGKVARVAVSPSCSIQSIAIHARDGELDLRLKDVGNGTSDRRISFTCALASKECAPHSIVASLGTEASGWLEVTGITARRGHDAQPTLANVPGLDLRSVQASPSGRWISYISRETGSDDREVAIKRAKARGEFYTPGRSTLAEWGPRRTLWVREATTGRSVRVADGEEHLHALWMNDDALVWERDRSLTPAVLHAADALMPEIRAAGIATDPEQQHATSVAHALQRMKLTAAWSAPLAVFHPGSGRSEPFNSDSYARLLAFSMDVRVVGDGRVIDVDPDTGPSQEALDCPVPEFVAD